MRDVIILGSTGSIGTQAVDVISSRQDEFNVVGLAAGGTNTSALLAQIETLHPAIVAVADEVAGAALQRETSVRVLSGSEAVVEVAAFGADVVLNAITGAAGLEATMATLAAGSTLALANKESLVIGGPVVKKAAAPGQIVPVDSEHSAFAQALRSGKAKEVRRLILTASGGPFRGWKSAQLLSVTPEQALAHPTWNMGRVVTINSSTLVNKGLELIEAGLLFDVDLDDITVVVHPQSLVHSMVEFIDGSTIAQCSPPDMRLPIALGLAWPNRVAGAAKASDWSKASSWTFEPVDNEVFPAVELARKVGKASGMAPAVFNAANEVAVDAFCDGALPFPHIVELIHKVVNDHLSGVEPLIELSVRDVLAADAWARARARSYVETWGSDE